MRITPENVVIRRGVEIYLDVVLTIVEQRCRGIGGIVAKTRPGWRGVKRRVEQGRCYGINQRRDHIVGKRCVAVLRVIKLVCDKTIRARVARIARTGELRRGDSIIANPRCESAATDITKVSSPLRCREYIDELSRGGVIETLSLIIEEEKQLVLEDRTTDCASEHVPAQGGSLSILKFIFPGIRVQLVIAEILPEVSMEAVRAGFDRGTDNASLKVSEFG